MTKTPWNCKKCGSLLGHWERKCVQYGDKVFHREELTTLSGVQLIGFGRVPCACGAVRDWEPGRQSLEALIALVQKQHKIVV